MTKRTTVRRITPQDPEYWQSDSGPAVARGNAGAPHVTNDRAALVPAQRRPAQPIDINMPQQAVLTVDVRTNAVDRANGFKIETDRLALFGATLAVLISWVGYGNPLLTLGTLLVFGVWFVGIYFAMWLIHRILTPEFIALFNAVVAALLAFRRG